MTSDTTFEALPAADIEVFTQAHCSPCRQVEALLRDHGVAFLVRRVDTDAAALEVLADHGYMGTPVTRIGETWIAGYHRGAIERALAASGL
jgi:glutaredoxin